MDALATNSPRSTLRGDAEQVLASLSNIIAQIELPAGNLDLRNFPDREEAITADGFYTASLTLSGPAPDRYAEHYFGEKAYVTLSKRTTDPSPELRVSFKEPGGNEVLSLKGEQAVEIGQELTRRVGFLKAQERLTLAGFARALPSYVAAASAPGMVPMPALMAEALQGQGFTQASIWKAGDLSDPRGRPVIHTFEEGLAQPQPERLEVPFSSLNSLALGTSQQILTFTTESESGATQWLTGTVGDCRFQISRSLDDASASQPSGFVWYHQSAGMNKFDSIVGIAPHDATDIWKALKLDG